MTAAAEMERNLPEMPKHPGLSNHFLQTTFAVATTLIAAALAWVFSELSNVDVLATKVDFLEQNINLKFDELKSTIEKNSNNPKLEKIENSMNKMQHDLNELKLSIKYWQKEVELHLAAALHEPAAGLPDDTARGDEDTSFRYVPRPYRPTLPPLRHKPLP